MVSTPSLYKQFKNVGIAQEMYSITPLATTHYACERANSAAKFQSRPRKHDRRSEKRYLRTVQFHRPDFEHDAEFRHKRFGTTKWSFDGSGISCEWCRNGDARCCHTRRY